MRLQSRRRKNWGVRYRKRVTGKIQVFCGNGKEKRSKEIEKNYKVSKRVRKGSEGAMFLCTSRVERGEESCSRMIEKWMMSQDVKQRSDCPLKQKEQQKEYLASVWSAFFSS